MSVDSNKILARTKSKLPLLRIAYTELQYWCVGLTPEGYHWSQGSTWEQYGNHRRAAKHLKLYLKYKENAYARALLAYCYARLSAWEDASREYAAVLTAWPHPSFSLALAEAHLHLGSISQAMVLVAKVEAEHQSPDSPLPGLEDLKRRVKEASNKSLKPP